MKKKQSNDLPFIFIDDDGPWEEISMVKTLGWFCLLVMVLLILGILAGYLIDTFV